MHQLALYIQDNLDPLVAEYGQHLRALGGYSEMPEQVRLEWARDALQFVATSLQTRDHKLRTQSVEAIATEWQAQGLDLQSVEQALTSLGETLESRSSTIKEANLLWRTIAKAQVVLSRRVVEELRATSKALQAEKDRSDALLAGTTEINELIDLQQTLQESLERRARQVQTSTEVAQEIAAAPALDNLYQRVVTLVKERFGYYHAQLFLLNEEEAKLQTVAGYGQVGRTLQANGHFIPMGKGVVGRAGASGKPLLSSDVSQDPEWLYHPLLPDTRGELAVPVTLRDQVLGVLDVQSDVANALNKEDQLLLEGLSGQIAIAIESTRLRQEAEERLHELEHLTRAMSREGWEAFRRERRSIGYLCDQANLLPADDLWLPEIGLATERQDLVPSSANGGRAAVAPLSVRGGEFIGVLGVQDNPQFPLSEEELALVESVSQQVAQSLENARLFEETRQRLQHLTTLSNVGQALAGAPLQPAEIADIVARQFFTVLEVPEVSVSLADPANEDLMHVLADVQSAQMAAESPNLMKAFRLSDFPATAHVMETLRPLVVHATDADADPAELAYMEEYGTQTLGILPLAVKGQAFGVIELETGQQERHFTPEELSLAMTLANQAAIALENARLFEETRARADDQATLRRITETVSRSLDLGELLDATLKTVLSALDLDAGLVSLLDKTTGQLYLASQKDVPEPMVQKLQEDGLAGTLCDYVLQTGETIAIADVRQGSPVDVNGVIQQGLLTYAGTPLNYKDERIGTFCFFNHSVREMDNREVALLEAVGEQVAVGVANARLFDEAQRRAEELDVLNELGRALTARLTVDEVLEEAYRQASRLVDTTNFYVGLYDKDKEEIRFPLNITQSEIDRQIQSISANQGLTGYVIHHRTRLLIKENVGAHQERLGIPMVGEESQSWMGVPLMVGERVLGAMAVQSHTTPRLYDEHDLELMSAIGAAVANALQNAFLFEQIQQTAQTLAEERAMMQDTLNELERVTQAMSHQGWEAVRRKAGAIGYRFNQGGDLDAQRSDVVPAHDLWQPEIGLAAQQQTPIAPNESDKPVAVAPLSVRGGELIGVVGVQDDPENPLSRDELALVEELSQELGRALESARLFDESQARAREQAILNELGQALAASQGEESVLWETYQGISRLMGAENCYIMIYDPDAHEVSLAMTVIDGEVATPRTVQPVEELGLTEHLITNRQPLLIPNRVSERVAELGLASIPLSPGRSSVSWLGVPMMIGDRVLGTIVILSYTTPGAYDEHSQDLLSAVANQTALALENVRLLASTQAALAEVQATHRTYLRRSWQEHLHQREILQRCGFLYDGTQSGQAGDLTLMPDLWRPEMEQALSAKGPNLIESEDEEARAGLAVPITLRGQTLGVLGVEDPARQWTEDDAALIEAVSEQLAQTLESARLYADTQRRAEQMATLNRIGLDLTAGLELQRVLESLYEQCRQVLTTDSFCVALYDENTGLIEFPLLTGRDGPTKLEPARIQDQPGFIAHIIQSAQPLHVPDTHAMPEGGLSHPHMIDGLPDRSYAGVPLTARGKVFGVLSVQSDQPNAYTDQDIELLTTIATQAAIAVENARAYERLVETAEELREVDRLKTQFLANMSHELRTPLNSIIGFSRVMLKGIDGPLTELQQTDLTSIHNSGQHLLSLINSILDMSKIEAGKMDFSFEEIDLKDVFRTVTSTTTALIKDRPIELQVEVPDDLPSVWADAQRVRQVLINLLSNATKFTEEGYILLKAEAGPEFVTISVADTGIGIEPEAQKRLFIPFQQVDASTTRRAGGTGLGLAICRSFVELHGGEIWVESEPGQGSSFFFTLPVHQIAVKEGQEEGEFDLEPDKKLMLAIDDDEGVIALLKRYLEGDGYQVVGVREPLKALETARHLAPHLTAITLDVVMPNMDGWQVLRTLKEDPRTEDIPVILVSIVEGLEQGLSRGATACLRKPVTRDEMLEALQKTTP